MIWFHRATRWAGVTLGVNQVSKRPVCIVGGQNTARRFSRLAVKTGRTGEGPRSRLERRIKPLPSIRRTRGPARTTKLPAMGLDCTNQTVKLKDLNQGSAHQHPQTGVPRRGGTWAMYTKGETHLPCWVNLRTPVSTGNTGATNTDAPTPNPLRIADSTEQQR